MTRWAAMWGAAFLSTAILDAVAITQVIGPAVEAQAGPILAESPDMIAALGFYLLYPLAIVQLAAMGRAPGAAARQGAFLGLACYGTYELTNKAVLEGWGWNLVALDSAWGMIVTAAGAFAAAVAARALDRRAAAQSA